MKPFRHLPLTILSLISLLSLLSLFPLRAFAQDKSLIWQRYDVDITVKPNGDMRVVEIQQIEFQSGAFTQGFAQIPTDKTDGITDFGVREGDRVYTASSSGGPYTFQFNPNLGEVDWNFPETGPGIHTYELAYTVKGGIKQYPEGDELQWKAVSSERDFAALASTITVHLPPGGLPIQGRIVAFSPAQIEWKTTSDTTVAFTAMRGLRAGEGIEIGVAFKHGAIKAPPPAWQTEADRQKATQSLLDLVSIVLAVLALLAVPVGLYLLWYLAGRDPSPGVVPEYVAAPPTDLPPGVIGTLIDEKADTPDVVATVVDLARKGALTIEETATTGEFGAVNREYELKKQPMPAGLANYEQTLYNALFGKQDSRKLTALSGSLYADFQRIRQQLYEEVVRRGLFGSNPDSVRGRYRGLGIAGVVLFGAGFCCTTLILGQYSSYFPCLSLVFGLGSLALVFLAGRMPAKTRKGAEEAAKWRAFQTYLANIEKYRDLQEATDQFEKYLPYAIAFGMERRWVTAFSKVKATPVPGWYIPRYGPLLVPGRGIGAPKDAAIPRGVVPGGAGGVPSLSEVGAGMAGGLQSFSDGFVAMLNTTARTLNIQPASTYSGSYVGSGSRGFSGGSFRSSGGGFRGGGGGGGGARGFR